MGAKACGQGAHATQTQGQPRGAQNGNRQAHRPSRKLCWSFQDHGKCERRRTVPLCMKRKRGVGGKRENSQQERRPQGGSGPPQTKRGEGPQARKFSPRRQLTPAAPRQLVGLQPTMERGANVIQVFRLQGGESGEHMATGEGEEESMSGAPQDQSRSGGVSLKLAPRLRSTLLKLKAVWWQSSILERMRVFFEQQRTV